MIYPLLRGIAGVALRWYYADVTMVGDTRAIRSGPLLVVVNHPNALVDVLVAGRALPRRLLLTAKSTLFSNPIAGALLSWVGVLPLRRASDEKKPGAILDPGRNAEVFAAITKALGRGGAVLIFPEGRTHDEPEMSPFKSGAARLAINARDSGIRGLRILPVGLIFERKDAARSRILSIIGEPLSVDAWKSTTAGSEIAELTAEMDRRLRAVTLNYATADEAVRDAMLSEQISALIRYEAPSVGYPGDLRDQTLVARLLPAVRGELARAPETLRARAEAFERDLDALRVALDSHRISLNDLAISRGIREGATFVAREAAILAIAGPLAFWGWLNHFIPFRAALAAGRRVRHSAADPAMRTIVAGIAFVLMVYMLQGALVTLIAGPWVGLAYVASLPVAADVNLRLRERLDRAMRRARTYLLFRSQPALQEDLETRARALRAEALALAEATGASAA